jgi:hypothetical protein
MNSGNNCRKVVSGICLNLVTSMSHTFHSKLSRNNSGTTRTLEAAINFVNKLPNSSCFTLHSIEQKHDFTVATSHKNYVLKFINLNFSFRLNNLNDHFT